MSTQAKEYEALLDYRDTLELLLERWSPERQIEALLLYSEAGGFIPGTHLWDQNVEERIERHKKRIYRNYEYATQVVEFISSRKLNNVG